MRKTPYDCLVASLNSNQTIYVVVMSYALILSTYMQYIQDA